MTATAATLHFRVDSAYIVKQARDFMLEQGYNIARDFLQTAYGDEITVDIIEDILSGKTTMEGFDIGHLVPQDPNCPEYLQYAERLQDANAGKVYWRSKWWVPYARVGALGPDDVPGVRTPRHELLPDAASTSMIYGRATRPAWGCYRVLYYADNPTSDLVISLNMVSSNSVHNESTLWKSVDPPPPWLLGHYRRRTAVPSVDVDFDGQAMIQGGMELIRFQCGLEEFVKQRFGLPVRQWESPTRKPVDDVCWPVGYAAPIPDTKDVEPPACDPVRRDLFLTAVAAGLPADKAIGTIDHILGVEAPEPEPDNVSSSRYGVITADGKYWPCKFHGHDELIATLVQKLRVEVPSHRSDTEHATCLGWVKVHGNIEPSDVIFGCRKPTEKAVATMEIYWAMWCRELPFDSTRWG